MSLKYQPKGALSPRLARIMVKLSRLVQDEGLMAGLVISDGPHTEHFTTIDPEWSCVRLKSLPGGATTVNIRSKREDYTSSVQQREHLERTVNGLASLFKCLDMQRGNLAIVMEKLSRELDIAHTGEEHAAHTAEPVNPDRVPATVGEAANMILATLTPENLTWLQETPLFEALPALDGFGRELRNSWSLWGDTPLRQHVVEKYHIFGHSDDIASLIFSWLWAVANGKDPEEQIQAELGGIRSHWKSQGLNPETGERELIV